VPFWGKSEPETEEANVAAIFDSHRSGYISPWRKRLTKGFSLKLGDSNRTREESCRGGETSEYTSRSKSVE